MIMHKKIVCLGAGSSYFPVALVDIVADEALAGSEITLYDIDLRKAEGMAAMAARLAGQAGTGMKIRACRRLADAIDGADFALSAIGGAGTSLSGVYGTTIQQQDRLIPAKYGIYQTIGDTGGPGGMMMALRSVPIYLAICREMVKRCPDVLFINHSNPMAILCRAMIKYSGIKKVIGICHGVQGGIVHAARLLGVPPEELETTWVGTNHCYWFLTVRHRGKDVYPALRRLEETGYVRSKWEKQAVAQAELRPPRKYYELTKAGKAVLAEAVSRYRLLEQSPLTARDPNTAR